MTIVVQRQCFSGTSQIQDVLDSADDTEYIAEIAREKLGYVAPGERVFVDISSK